MSGAHFSAAGATHKHKGASANKDVCSQGDDKGPKSAENDAC